MHQTRAFLFDRQPEQARLAWQGGHCKLSPATSILPQTGDLTPRLALGLICHTRAALFEPNRAVWAEHSRATPAHAAGKQKLKKKDKSSLWEEAQGLLSGVCVVLCNVVADRWVCEEAQPPRSAVRLLHALLRRSRAESPDRKSTTCRTPGSCSMGPMYGIPRMNSTIRQKKLQRKRYREMHCWLQFQIRACPWQIAA